MPLSYSSGENMKKILLGIAAVGALMATPVLAADMPSTAPVSLFSWSGCCVGANIGDIWEHDSPPITLFDSTGIRREIPTSG